jgi:hypothetical protein
MNRKDDEKNDLTARDWLGLRKVPDWAKARLLGGAAAAFIGLLLIWALVIAIGAMAAMTQAVFAPTTHTGLSGGGTPADLRGIAVFVTAFFGAPFLIWRTVIAAKQADLQDEGLFNDKINAAAEDLAARRQVTRVVYVRAGKDDAGGAEGAKDGGEAELEEKILLEWEDDVVTRSAAIDRLEGLARERAQTDPDVVGRIASLLSVYVRELSRHDLKPLEHGLSEKDATPRALADWARGLGPIRSDLEKAAQVLGRLRRITGQSNLVLDLRNANLQGFDLQGLDFENARLSSARIEGANLRRAKMQGAVLRGAQMQGADLGEAEMQGADLGGAQMQGADLSGAEIDQSTWATETTFSGAGVTCVDWSSADLSTAHVAALFGDASVKLPFDNPAWWPDIALDWDGPASTSPWHIEFAHWRAAPDTYDWDARRQHYTADGEINPDNRPP